MNNSGQLRGQWGLILLRLPEKPMEWLPESTSGKKGSRSVWTSASILHWWKVVSQSVSSPTHLNLRQMCRLSQLLT